MIWLEVDQKILISNLDQGNAYPPNVINLYMHLFQEWRERGQNLARKPLFTDQSLSLVDQAALRILGKRFVKAQFDSAQFKQSELVELKPFQIQESLIEKFYSKKEVTDRMKELNKLASMSELAPHLRPRSIFAVAEVKTQNHSAWFLSQNRQDLNRSFHAEVVLLMYLAKKQLEAGVVDFWISLSPCQMCGAYLNSVFSQIKLRYEAPDLKQMRKYSFIGVQGPF